MTALPTFVRLRGEQAVLFDDGLLAVPRGSRSHHLENFMSTSSSPNVPTARARRVTPRSRNAVSVVWARIQLSEDPAVGEAALSRCRDLLLRIRPSTVASHNIDCMHAAAAAMALVVRIETPELASTFALMPAVFLGDATAALLRTLAQTLFYLETRERASRSVASEPRVDGPLITEGLALRERMKRVLEYHFWNDAEMQAELSPRRSSRGRVRLADDLARLAAHYTAHAARLARDPTHDGPSDAARARVISQAIHAALKASADDSTAALRNRAFTKLARVYARLKATGDYIFADKPAVLALFPSLRQAVLAQGRGAPRLRARGATGQIDGPPARSERGSQVAK